MIELQNSINEDCVKILHIDTAHWLFHNTAEHQRLLALQQRRKLTLPTRRSLKPNSAIECADYATILGNEFTISTYQYANKPLYRVPISAPVEYPWPEDKDFDASRRHFLWFGSVGFVHKGLDLVLEAFAEMPDYQLTVCGPIDRRGTSRKPIIGNFTEPLTFTPLDGLTSRAVNFGKLPAVASP